jgi:hypothetical protein
MTEIRRSWLAVEFSDARAAVESWPVGLRQSYESHGDRTRASVIESKQQAPDFEERNHRTK